MPNAQAQQMTKLFKTYTRHFLHYITSFIEQVTEEETASGPAVDANSFDWTDSKHILRF